MDYHKCHYLYKQLFGPYEVQFNVYTFDSGCEVHTIRVKHSKEAADVSLVQ